MPYELRVPRISSNDDSVTLKMVRVADMQHVAAETIVAILEDSKATYEVEAEAAGYIRWAVDPGQPCSVGTVMALLFETEGEAQASAKPQQPPAPSKGTEAAPSGGDASAGLTVTQAAQTLIDEHGIKPEDLRALGRSVIRKSDIAGLLAKRPGALATRTLTLSRRQVAIGRVVSESHATIPQAFLIVRVLCDRLLEQLGRRPIGLNEILVRLVPELSGQFPEFFSGPCWAWIRWSVPARTSTSA